MTKIQLSKHPTASSSSPTRQTGNNFEKLALHYLLRQGLQPVCENFFCKTGEIDLIMYDKATLVFIEVRYRAANSYGNPAATVTAPKQLRIKKTAAWYLLKNKLTNRVSCRFDVIGISTINKDLQFHWIKSAFH